MRTRCDKSNVDLQDFCCKEQKNKKNLSFAGVCACVFVNFETKWHLEVAYEIESRQKKKKKKKKKNSQKKKKNKNKIFQYDLSAGTYSRDGRIYQIEYANKAVESAG
jgi:UDP-2,3-diacylglucosamine pyrophosphatase LpxH